MRKNLINRFCFSQKERLSQRADIKAVFSRGKRVSNVVGSLFVLSNSLSYARFLCTFRRGFAHAVKRNRMRRLCKEVYRKNKYRIKKGFDVVFLVFRYSDSFSECKDGLLKLFEMASIIEI